MEAQRQECSASPSLSEQDGGAGSGSRSQRAGVEAPRSPGGGGITPFLVEGMHCEPKGLAVVGAGRAGVALGREALGKFSLGH